MFLLKLKVLGIFIFCFTSIVYSAWELSLSKTVEKVEVGNTNLVIPGALITYKIIYSNLGDEASNVIIYDKIPDNTSYYTNYSVTASGWIVEFAHINSPNQAYGSSDYDITNTNVTWVRFRKEIVTVSESNLSLYVGVIIN